MGPWSIDWVHEEALVHGGSGAENSGTAYVSACASYHVGADVGEALTWSTRVRQVTPCGYHITLVWRRRIGPDGHRRGYQMKEESEGNLVHTLAMARHKEGADGEEIGLTAVNELR